ncbi:STAS domain-containing protein [bacterium]|nr:STAS domain-containing protein [bacterium]
MKVKERRIGDVGILDLSGKLLGGPPGSQNVKDAIYRFLDQGVSRVVINLDQVTRMNSSGLGILISAMTSLKNKDGELRLAGVNETMEGILVMTKLNSIFDIYDTAEGAAQSF